MFGKSDPFLRVSRPHESAAGTSWAPVLQSGVVMNNLNPVWPALKVALGRLCAGDLSAPLLWECVDWDSNGSHDPIGQARGGAEG